MRTILDTITTYDTERGTTQTTRVIPLFEFYELNEDAKNKVVKEYAEERANDPYHWQWFSDTTESEIWDCVHDLENSIYNARVSWNYNRWYSCDFDCEYSYSDIYDPCELYAVEDNGICYSMDLCDAWNAHLKRLNGICYRIEYLDHLCDDVYYYEPWYMGAGPENETFYKRLDSMRDDLISLWYEELEKACEDVQSTIESLLRGEWEYYTSEEYTRAECEDAYAQGDRCYTCEYPYYRNGGYAGRVYYSDNRKWYTADGELFEQSDINHECISIVLAS